MQQLRGHTSFISIDSDIVIKEITRKKYNFDLYRNELYWLKEMDEFDRVPSVLEYDDEKKTIKMQYVGERITKDNIPEDWQEQMKYILAGLEKYRCCHNDIKPGEILVKDGKLYLVDFGWSTKKGEKITRLFPRQLGGRFKKGRRNYDDEYSFTKSIEHVLNIIKKK